MGFFERVGAFIRQEGGGERYEQVDHDLAIIRSVEDLQRVTVAYDTVRQALLQYHDRVNSVIDGALNDLVAEERLLLNQYAADIRHELARYGLEFSPDQADAIIATWTDESPQEPATHLATESAWQRYQADLAQRQTLSGSAENPPATATSAVIPSHRPESVQPPQEDDEKDPETADIAVHKRAA